MIITGNAYLDDFHFHSVDIEVQNGIIEKIIKHEYKSQECKMQDDFILPGLIDTHFHGCVDADYSDADVEGIRRMARYQFEHGVVAMCPATMTLPYNQLEKICQSTSKYRDEEGLAKLVGIYLEGPFLSKEKCGAQKLDYLANPDIAEFKRLQNLSENMIKVCVIAPELDGSSDFIKAVSETGCVVSMGHTTANYNIAKNGVQAGASRVTHFYNAMLECQDIENAIKQREDYYIEIICDGVHNSKERILHAFETFGAEHIVLISDSMRATGLGDGDYTLGGQKVHVKGKDAFLDNGSRAGSVTNLYDCFKTALDIGVPTEDAIRAVTYNPARSIGILGEYGVIKEGCPAKFIVTDRNFNKKELLY